MDAPVKLSFFQKLIGSITRRPANTVPRAAIRDARRTISLCHALLSERGDISGARFAREALTAYQQLDESALGVFFDLLVKEFSPDPEEVGRLADAYRRDASQGNLIRLQHAVEPPVVSAFQHGDRRHGGFARNAAPAVATTGSETALRRHRRRPRPSIQFVVQPGLSRAAEDRLAHLGAGAGEADSL